MNNDAHTARNLLRAARRMSLNLERLEPRFLLSAPVVQSLQDAPDPVEEGTELTLTAGGVQDSDPGDSIDNVTFYRDGDEDGVPEAGEELGVGTRVGATDTYVLSVNADWAIGDHTYLVQAESTSGELSNVVGTSGTVNDRPQVAELEATPRTVAPGDTITLNADTAGVTDQEGGVEFVDFFHDSNNNGMLDGEDFRLSRDFDISDGWGWTGEVTWTEGSVFAVAQDVHGARTPDAEAAWGPVNIQPIVEFVFNDPNPVEQDFDVTFTAPADRVFDTYDPFGQDPGLGGTVSAVQFWRDDGDGAFDPLTDNLLGTDTDGADGWSTTVVADWVPDDTPIYYARALDEYEQTNFPSGDRVWGDAAFTLNQNPRYDHVAGDLDPAHLENDFNLQAFGVTDADGFIDNVKFWVKNPDGGFRSDADDPQIPDDFLARDVTGFDEYTWDFAPQWRIADSLQEDFNGDGFADVAVAVDVTPNMGPDFVSILFNDTRGGFTARSMVELNGTPFDQLDMEMAAGDFNGDSLPDLAVADSDGRFATGQTDGVDDQIYVLLNEGDGTFSDFSTYEIDFFVGAVLLADSVTTGDLDGDGNLDLAVTGPQAFTDFDNLFNTGEQVSEAGDGSWDTPVGTAGEIDSLILFHDANGNGFWEFGEDIWLDDGSEPGVFDQEDHKIHDLGDWDLVGGESGINGNLVFNDVDEDFEWDPGEDIWIDEYGSESSIAVLYGDGTGAFALTESYEPSEVFEVSAAASESIQDIEAADMDQDGDVDLVTISPNGPFILWNNGSGVRDGLFEDQGNVIGRAMETGITGGNATSQTYGDFYGPGLNFLRMSPGDVDFYRVTLEQGTTLNVSVSYAAPPPNNAVRALFLYGADIEDGFWGADEITNSAVPGADGLIWTGSLSFTPQESGDYYVALAQTDLTPVGPDYNPFTGVWHAADATAGANYVYSIDFSISESSGGFYDPGRDWSIPDPGHTAPHIGFPPKVGTQGDFGDVLFADLGEEPDGLWALAEQVWVDGSGGAFGEQGLLFYDVDGDGAWEDSVFGEDGGIWSDLDGDRLYDMGETQVYAGADGWNVNGQQALIFYDDANESGVWDFGEDIWLDDGTNPLFYDAADTDVFNGGDGTFDVAVDTPGSHGTLHYYDVDQNGSYTDGSEDIWQDQDGDGLYDSSDQQVYDGGNGWNITPAQDDLYFDDHDQDGEWTAGDDVWLDVDGDGLYDPGDTVVTGGWDGWDIAAAQGRLYFDDSSGDGDWDAGEDIWVDEVINGTFDDADRLVYIGLAQEVSPGDAGSQNKLYFDDHDGDGTWQEGEDIWEDENGNALFDGGDGMIFDGGDGSIVDPLDGWQVGGSPSGLFFFDANQDGSWGPGEDVWADQDGFGLYDQGEPRIPGSGDRWSIPGSQDGLYFIDANGSGVWDSDEEVFVSDFDSTYDLGEGVYDGGDGSFETVPGTPGIHGRLYYDDAEGDADRDFDDSIWQDNGRYLGVFDAEDREIVGRSPTGSEGNIYYNDEDMDGEYDLEEEVWADLDQDGRYDYAPQEEAVYAGNDGLWLAPTDGYDNGAYDEEMHLYLGGDSVWNTQIGQTFDPALPPVLHVNAEGGDNRIIEEDEATWVDANTDGLFNPGETVINGTAPEDGTAGLPANAFISDVNENGTWEPGVDEVWTDAFAEVLSGVGRGRYNGIQEFHINPLPRDFTPWDTWDYTFGTAGNPAGAPAHLTYYDTDANGEFDVRHDFLWANEPTGEGDNQSWNINYDVERWSLDADLIHSGDTPLFPTHWLHGSGDYWHPNSRDQGVVYPDPLDKGIRGDLFFRDDDGNGEWDWDSAFLGGPINRYEPVWAEGTEEVDETETFDPATDTVVYDPLGVLEAGDEGIQGNIIFHDVDGDGTWDEEGLDSFFFPSDLEGPDFDEDGAPDFFFSENIWVVRDREQTPDKPHGAGDSLDVVDFLEDPLPSDIDEIDVATVNSATDRASVLLGNIWMTTEGPAYMGWLPYEENNVMSGKGQSVEVGANPVSVTAAHLDQDDGVPDLVIANSGDGSVSVVTGINASRTVEDGGILEYSVGDYRMSDNPVNQPFLLPGDVLVGNFDQDPRDVQELVVADKYNLAVLSHGYPYLESDPLDLNRFESEIPQVGDTFGFRNRYSVIPWDDADNEGYLEVTYYSQAYDNDFDPVVHPQYLGFSAITEVEIPFNQPPSIWEVVDDRRVIGDGEVFTLTARGVVDPDGFTDEVRFYLDDGRDGVFDDDLPGIHANVYFHDENDDGRWTEGEDVWADENDPGVFNPGLGDVVVYDGGTQEIDLGFEGFQNGLFIYDGVDENGRWDPGEDVWAEEDANSQFDRETDFRVAGADEVVVGVDSNGANGWSWTGTLPDTGTRYWARAVDNAGGRGKPTSTLVNDRPETSGIFTDGRFVPDGPTDTLSNDRQVYDPDGLLPDIHGPDANRLRFSDLDGDGQWDYNEDVWFDDDEDGDYTPGYRGDWRVSDGDARGLEVVDGITVGTSASLADLYFYDPAGDGHSDGDDLWVDLNANGEFDAGEEVFSGGDDWQVFVGADSANFSQTNLWFDDADGDDELDAGEDIFVSPDSTYDAGEEVFDGGDDWTTSDGADGLPYTIVGLREDRLLFRDSDFNGRWSETEEIWLDLDRDGVYDPSDIQIFDPEGAWETTPGQAGIVGNLLFADLDEDGEYSPVSPTGSAEPIWAEGIYEHEELTLSVRDVRLGGNSGGMSQEVRNVHLFRDSDFDGVFDPRTDQWLGRGTQLNSSSESDWYRFRMPDAGTSSSIVSLQFEHDEGMQAGNLDLFLYDGVGTQVAQSQSMTDNESIALNGMSPGTYFVEVEGVGGDDADYDLTIQTRLSGTMPDAYEGNDTAGAAADLGEISGSVHMSGTSISSIGDVDWYRFTTLGAGTDAQQVQIQFDDAAGNLDLELFDTGMKRLAVADSIDDDETISMNTLPEGTYLLKVSTDDAATNLYDLQFDLPTRGRTRGSDALEPNNAGPDRPVPEFADLGQISGKTTITGLGVRRPDQSDWTWTIESAEWVPATHEFFALVQDNHDDWSAVDVGTIHVRNRPPVVDALNATPDPVAEGAQLTLTAVGVEDPYGRVDHVVFFRDTNGVPGLQLPEDAENEPFDPDVQLGVDADGTDGYTFEGLANWRPGHHTYYARVIDNRGAWNINTASFEGVVNARPVFGGTLEPHVEFGDVPDLIDVVSADFNGDGKLDLAGLRSSGTVSVLTGLGGGEFSSTLIDTSVSANPTAFAMADFDRNGTLDLLISDDSTDSLHLYSGDGDGTFTASGAPVFVGGDFDPVSIALGDLDSDTRLDAVTANSADDSIGVFLWDNDAGAFVLDQTYDVGAAPADVVLADFNRDELLDVATVDSGDDQVTVIKGNADGTLEVTVAIPPRVTDLEVGANPQALVAADFNADGHMDVATANGGTQNISLLWGSGNDFATGVTLLEHDPLNPADTIDMGLDLDTIATGMLDSDLRPDLVVNTPNTDQVHVILNRAGREFAASQPYEVGDEPRALLLRDLNNDSALDIVTANVGSNDFSVSLGIQGLIDTGQFEEIFRGTDGQWQLLNDGPPVGDLEQGMLYFHDIDDNSVWDYGEDIWLDDPAGDTGLYDDGVDTQVYDGGDGWEAVDAQVGIQGNLYFHDSNLNGNYDLSEDLVADLDGPEPHGGIVYGSVQFDPAFQGRTLVLQATGVRDPDGDGTGDIEEVQFWRDTNDSGTLEPEVDELLDSDFAGRRVTRHGTEIHHWMGTVHWSIREHTYFARARDENGGWSFSVVQSGGVENPLPTIGALTLDPAVVTRGFPLTLIAEQVADLNGSVERVEFYLDSNNTDVFEADEDRLLGTDPTGTDEFSITVPGPNVDWEPTPATTYFARAQDDLGDWSDVARRDGSVNDRPSVASLVADPDLLSVGGTLTLTASGVSDPDGDIDEVLFYRDTNKTGAFEEAFDEIVGTDDTEDPGEPGTYQISIVDNTDAHFYFARARDDDGGFSFEATSQSVNRRPVTTSIEDEPDPVTQNNTLKLEAIDVFDIDGTVDSVSFFLDVNGNDVLDVGRFDAGLDDVVAGSPADGASGIRGNVMFEDLNGNRTWDVGETVWADHGTDDGAYDEDDDLIDGSAPDLGTAGELGNLYWADSGVPGTYEGEAVWADDLMLGSDTVPADGWSWEGPVAWQGGFHTYFARARDDFGNATSLANVPSTEGYVNQRPLISGEIDFDPDPVDRGDDLLISLDQAEVVDPDGSVDRVEFYRETNEIPGLQIDVAEADTLLGRDEDVTDGTWDIFPNTAGWEPGDNIIYARAEDNNNAWSSPLSGTVEVNLLPTLVGLDSDPSPATRGDRLTLEVDGASDSDGEVLAVEFWRDGNGNNELNRDPALDHFLGYDTSVDGGWNWSGTVLWAPGSHTYFAQAVDDDLARSQIARIDDDVNEAPNIGSFDAQDEVDGGDPLDLTATNVTDDAAVTGVDFYRSSTILFFTGSDDSPLAGSPAENMRGQQGQFAVNDTNENGFWDAGEEVWLDADGDLLYDWEWTWDGGDGTTQASSGSTAGIRGNFLFADRDGDEVFDPDEEIWSDQDGNGFYNPAADSMVYSGRDGLWSVAETLPGIQGNLFFHDRGDGNGGGPDGAWQEGEDIWADTPDGTAGTFDLIREEVVHGNGADWQTGPGMAGIMTNVVFNDANTSGSYDTGEAVWAEDMQLVGAGLQSGSDWSLVEPTTNWSRGRVLLTALAQDAFSLSDPALDITLVKGDPVLDRIEVDPDPIVIEEPATFSAFGAFDPDGDDIVDSQFYRETNGTAGLQEGGANPDTLLGNDSTAGDGFSITITPTGWTAGLQTFYGRVQDEDGNWSDEVSLEAEAGRRPIITGSTLFVIPDPLARGDELTLRVPEEDVFDPDPGGGIALLRFYRDDGDGVFNGFDDGDELLGTAEALTAEDNWEIQVQDTADWDLGNQIFFALAQDLSEMWSLPRAASGQIINNTPELGSLTVDPAPFQPGQELTFTASGVVDLDGTVDQVSFYWDEDGDGAPDPGELLGTDTSVNASAELLYSQTGNLPSGQLTFLAQGQDNDGALSNVVSTTVTSTQAPVITDMAIDPVALLRGQAITLTIEDANVNDPDGQVAGISYYRDADGDGQFDGGVDELLGTVTAPTSGLWQLTHADTLGWALGDQDYFGVATDDVGMDSAPFIVQGQVINNLPVIADLDVSPDLFSPGEQLTITASGIDDVDGTVQEVEIYRDLNGNSQVDPGQDQILGTLPVTNGSVDLTVTDTAGWRAGPHTFLARALDNDGDYGDPTAAAATVSYSLIEWGEGGGVTIAFYDVDSSDGVSDPNIAWGWGQFNANTDIVVSTEAARPGQIQGIWLFGDGSRTRDVGTAVWGRRGLSTFLDIRNAPNAPLAFLAVEGDVDFAQFNNGLEGARLDSYTFAVSGPPATAQNQDDNTWELPADPDLNGPDVDDMTGFFADGQLNVAILERQAHGDIVTQESLNVLISNRALSGDVTARHGGINFAQAMGSIHGNVTTHGDLGTLHSIGGDIEGAVRALGNSFASRIDAVRAIEAFNPAAGTVMGGSIHGGIQAGAGIGEVLATDDLDSDIDAGADLNNLVVLGRMDSADVTARGLGSVFVRGRMDDSSLNTTSGGLSSVFVQNGIHRSNISISGGSSGFVGTGGDLTDSLIQSNSRLDSVFVGRDYNNSSVEVRRLGSVHIQSDITADPGDRIHADVGGFWASWTGGGRGVFLSEDGVDDTMFGDLELSVD